MAIQSQNRGRNFGNNGPRRSFNNNNRNDTGPNKNFGGRPARFPMQKQIIEPHKHPGIFIIRGKEDHLATKSLVPGVSVYGEKLISVKTANSSNPDSTELPTEYRVWNPFRSKFAAALIGGIEEAGAKPGSRVLYLGAASGTTVSHVSDLVGENGRVYAVEFSRRCARELLYLAQRRANILPIVADARIPSSYRMIVAPPLVDVIISDVAQPDQARIVATNAKMFLKTGGVVLISIKAACVDSTAEPEAVFASEVQVLREMGFKPLEQISLEPYERAHAMVIARYEQVVQ